MGRASGLWGVRRGGTGEGGVGLAQANVVDRAGQMCVFALVFLFFVGGPRDIPFLPVEVVQNWQQAAVEVELPGGWTPEERWMSVERSGDVTLLAKDTQGVWHEMSYWCSAWDGRFYQMGGWETLSGTPDLTGFQQGLW